MIDFLKRNKAVIAVFITIILVAIGILCVENIDRSQSSSTAITVTAEPEKSKEPELTEAPTELPSMLPTVSPSATPKVKEKAAPEVEPVKEEVKNETKSEARTEYNLGEAITAEPKTDTTPKCTISVSCNTILNNINKLDREKHELIPSDGWILKPTEAVLNEGENVFDVLQRVLKDNKIHLEFMKTPVYDSAYIEGIHNLYEFDCGEMSGWVYCVNGTYPNYGCSNYKVQSGDVIEWQYTCDLGRDVSGSVVSQADE